MWLLYNEQTGAELLFNTVEEWHSFTQHHGWISFSARFIKLGKASNESTSPYKGVDGLGNRD